MLTFVFLKKYFMAVNSNALERQRKLLGKDGKEVSREMKISYSLLYSLESGRNKNPKINTVVQFCEYYNISVFEFLDKKTAKSSLLRFLYALVNNEVITLDAASKIYNYHFKENLSPIVIEDLFNPS